MDRCEWGVFKKPSKMMKKIGIMFSVFFFVGCSSADLQGNSFEDVWSKYTKEFYWGRRARFSQKEVQNYFLVWAQEFEKKRALVVRFEIAKSEEERDKKELWPASKLLTLSDQKLKDLFLDDGVVDFHDNDAAIQKLGAGDLFPATQKFIKINEIVGQRSVDLGGNVNKVGYVDKEGKYLPIFDGDVISRIVSLEEQEEFDFPDLTEERSYRLKFIAETIKQEEKILQGSTVLSGTNLSKNIEQYKMALEKLQTLTEQQEELKKLTRKVCEKQKTSVICTSLSDVN
jgi:hypothetical protein